MERLKRLNRFTPSQLLSTKHLLLVDEISEAHSDDDSFAQAIEKELQRAPGSCWSSDTLKSPSFLTYVLTPCSLLVGLAKSVWDQLERPLLDELYSPAASAHTKPLNSGKTSVQAGRWDIEAEARGWLAKQRSILEKVASACLFASRLCCC